MGVDKADVRTVVHEAVPARSRPTTRRRAARAATGSGEALLFAESRDKGLHVFFIQRAEVDERWSAHREGPGVPRHGRPIRRRACASGRRPDEAERCGRSMGHLAQAGVVAAGARAGGPAARAYPRRLRRRAPARACRTLDGEGTSARWRQYRAIWALRRGRQLPPRRRSCATSATGSARRPTASAATSAIPSCSRRSAGRRGAPARNAARAGDLDDGDPRRRRRRRARVRAHARRGDPARRALAKVLENSYDGLPAYGTFDHLTRGEVLDRVDGADRRRAPAIDRRGVPEAAPWGQGR